jgi:hypothetical protein
MGHHRAALRAKARRQKTDYWRKMRPFVVFLAGVITAVRRARRKRLADLFSGLLRERLNEPSFADLILPILHPLNAEQANVLGILPRPDEIVEYAFGALTTVHRTKGERSYIYASMDATTFTELTGIEAPMRINTVEHAQKKGLSCGKCGDKILHSRDEKQTVTDKRTGKSKKKIVRVLGDGYRWIKFNRGPKLIRCMKPACAFRSSDMTKGKMSGVYAAQETAQDAIAEWDGDVEDLKQILTDAAEAIREVAQEYSDSADNMEQVFTGGSPTIDECREKQESLESWADELEAIDFEEWDGPDEGDEPEEKDESEDEKKSEDDEPKNSQGQTRDEWREDQRSTAEEAIGNCPV